MLRLFLALATLCLAVFASAEETVKWSATLPADAKAGSTGKVELKAEIGKGWHLYSMTEVKDGPTPTSIEVVAPATLDGKIEQAKPTKKEDPNFGLVVEFYEDSATFEVPVKFGPDPTKDKLEVSYQTCNDRLCEPPKKVEVPLSGTPATPAVLKTTSSDAQDQGLLALIGAAITAGFLALLTPCVFPMIPITVSFFSKRRESMGPKQALAQAGAYCAGIVLAYTGFGVIVSALFGASGIQRFATNPWVNLVLAIIFVVLALSLFGLVQLNLPSKVTNAFSPSGKKGLAAPLLMGLTFTLTSFTCTSPFAGTILIGAAQGDLTRPLIGMFAFGTAFSLPFFLLALFPQYLARLPKSGSWLEMVKGFMGFLEIAAAIKFISNADLVWGTQLLTRPIFLGIWAVILAAAALFLLGVLKIPHVEIPKKIGVARLAVVGMSLIGAGWLSLGIAGRSLGEVEAFLPPGKDSGWTEDYERALAMSRAQGKPLLIDFTGVTCTNCRWMEKNMFPRPEVEQEFKGYILTRLFTDRQTTADRQNQALQQKLAGVVTLPVYVAVSPQEKVIKVFEGSTRNPQEFVTFLQQGAGRLNASRLP